MKKNPVRWRFSLHLFRSTFWNTGSGHIPHFFASCEKTKTPDFAWKSGVYCYLRFFKVVPPGIEPGTQGFSVLCSSSASESSLTLTFQSGATRNRTGDTRIFSPLLFFGIRKLADAHFWMQPTELWHFMNQ